MTPRTQIRYEVENYTGQPVYQQSQNRQRSRSGVKQTEYNDVQRMQDQINRDYQAKLEQVSREANQKINDVNYER